MNYKVKIIMKYRGANNVEHSIPAQEAHKAYWLFLNPDPKNRTIFSNGIAVKADDIERIVPDFNGTMGWNETHILGDEDWNEIHRFGVDKKLQDICIKAQKVARLGEKYLNLPLTEAVKVLPAISDDIKRLADKMKA